MGIKVIGIGNILMGDDSIGIRVIGIIRDRLMHQGMEVIEGETDIQYCISRLRDKDFIYIIDAAFYGEEAGDITLIPINEYSGSRNLSTQHGYNLLDLLNIYHRGIMGYVIGIKVKSIKYGIGISSELENKIEGISSMVFESIMKLRPSV